MTFNYRYTPARTQLKDILMSGAIGEITAVDFRWYLDRVHGADYFRRWHRYKEKSGGLLVHKSTPPFRSDELVGGVDAPRPYRRAASAISIRPKWRSSWGWPGMASAATIVRWRTNAISGWTWRPICR